MQYVLKKSGDPDYYLFRLPYWDFRIEVQQSSGILSDDLFSEKMMGATKNISGYPIVIGDMIEPNGWETVCAFEYSKTCDPRIRTGPLKRCPFTGNDPCNHKNPEWPTIKQVNDILSVNIYDAPPYNQTSKNGFRHFADFYVSDNFDDCRKDPMCFCTNGPTCNLTGVPPNTVFAVKCSLHPLVS